MNRKLAAAIGLTVGGAALVLSIQVSAQAAPVQPVSEKTASHIAAGEEAEPQAILSVAAKAAKAARSATRHLAGGDDVSLATVPGIPVDHAFDQ
ncbi:hypothetical protein [Streptomyces sparsus]